MKNRHFINLQIDASIRGAPRTIRQRWLSVPNSRIKIRCVVISDVIVLSLCACVRAAGDIVIKFGI